MQGARTTRTSRPSLAGRSRKQTLGARHGAGERVAHPHRDGRRRRLAFLHHVEMGVEGRDLVDFGERELHLLRQRREMRGGEMAVAVLDQVQVLDQQVAPARPVAEQRAHLVERLRLDLAALRRARRLAAAAGWLVDDVTNSAAPCSPSGAEISPTRRRRLSPGRPIWRFRSRRTWRDSPAICDRAQPDRSRCPSAAAVPPACGRSRRRHH